MSIPNPFKNIMTAFYQWKIYAGIPMTQDYALRNRMISLNMVASIMTKNLSIIKKLAFHEIKD